MSDEAELDKFKDQVYREIRWLEFYEKDLDFKRREGRGCLGAAFSGLLRGMLLEGRERMKRYRKVNELKVDAREILARPGLKKELCQVLDGTVRLPIDVANVITSVLYSVKGKGESISRDPVLYALISMEISNMGTAKYCSSRS